MFFQNQEQTKEYFQRRIDYVTGNIEKLQKALMEKYKIGEGKCVNDVIKYP